MFGKNDPVNWLRMIILLGAVALVAGFLTTEPASANPPVGDPISWELRQELYVPVGAWVGQLRESKNAFGKPNKSGIPSKTPRKIDDSTWKVTVHVNTAEETRQVTERYELTLQQKPGEKKWSVVKEEKVDEHVGLFRISGLECYPFDKFSFDREGLELSASNGSMCESYLEGEVFFFGVHAPDMTYEYAPPEYAGLVPTGHDFYAIHGFMSRDHSQEMGVSPVAYWVTCDKHSCEELIASSFTGLTRAAKERRSQAGLDVAAVPDWASAPFERWRKERRENPFAHFRPLDFPGNRYYSIFVARDLKPRSYGGTLATALPGSGVVLEYNNWGGWEVQFSVFPKRIDIPEQIVGPLYGYFSEETLKTTDPYELERRSDLQNRWFEVHSVNGVVELAIEDSETISADLEFGLTLREDIDELPFFINSQRPNATFGTGAPAPLFVNSVRLDGEELTWVRTGSTTGRVVLPERMPAGSELDISMSYTTRAIINYTHSYSYLNRFGWMPFVGFGDFIDEFDMIVKLPAKNEILGVGHKVSEEVKDGVRISHWRADQPVVFPTIIFGRYKADRPRFEAKKADGTVIPIEVHVDDASFVDWGIPPKSLRPIAEQAANAINLYREVSGLDYPYGELNLVNDPKGFLYGQAPSSLIFLGSGVFRGEGFLAPFFNNATGIAKFLKSVVAHEVGHQWWGSRVANANSRNYWFVESLAEYFSAIYLEAVFGWKEYEEQVDAWRRAILDTRLKSGVQNASSLFPGEDGFESYQAAVYSKGPYAFHMLREMFKGEGPRGPEGADRKFFEALKEMSQDLASKREIVTLDIQNSAEQALGGVGPDGVAYAVDLDWFFDQWIRGAGIPQFSFQYQTRQSEDGNWIVEGSVEQRVVVGNKAKFDVLAGKYYRGRTSITVVGKDRQEYSYDLIVDGPTRDFVFKVPVEPRDVLLNKNGEMLTLDPLFGRGF